MSTEHYEFVIPKVSLEHYIPTEENPQQISMNDSPTPPDDLVPKDPNDIKLQFRTYKPYNKDLRTFQLASSTTVEDFAWITAESDQILQDYTNFDLGDKDFIDKNQLYVKPTWDLKRDVKSQFALLEQRTQDSIQILLQSKLAQEKLEQYNTHGDENLEK